MILSKAAVPIQADVWINNLFIYYLWSSHLKRGERLVEVLKQGKYEPRPVEHQVAIIFVATQGLLDKIPTDRIREFEMEFIERLTLRHDDVLRSIVETGTLSDEAREVFKKVATELTDVYGS
ncbi:MAG: hypothetical protein ACOCSK_03220 [Rhodothermales bacterium]